MQHLLLLVKGGRIAYCGPAAACVDYIVGLGVGYVRPEVSSGGGPRNPADYVIDVVTGRVALAVHGTREMPVWSDRLAPTDGAGATAAATLYARRVVESLATYLESLQRHLSTQGRG